MQQWDANGDLPCFTQTVCREAMHKICCAVQTNDTFIRFNWAWEEYWRRCANGKQVTFFKIKWIISMQDIIKCNFFELSLLWFNVCLFGKTRLFFSNSDLPTCGYICSKFLFSSQGACHLQIGIFLCDIEWHPSLNTSVSNEKIKIWRAMSPTCEMQFLMNILISPLCEKLVIHYVKLFEICFKAVFCRKFHLYRIV